MGYEEIARANHKNGNVCSVSLFKAFADKLNLSEEEAAQMAPAPRSEGGKCGGLLAGRKLLEESLVFWGPKCDFPQMTSTGCCLALAPDGNHSSNHGGETLVILR